ncbi:restriction endonuclease subunit S [Streptococcus oralis]|uniref:restriction endonuclease subunit S n=1 Tax=Streptococcus oralis TaxID=1303 RepID=UPI001CBE8920|nr:restriction endonuclease subunit S [Streptococcus oralis]MBZ2086925.1 restriction endonuclease subunit S [Streptococcus oralis]
MNILEEIQNCSVEWKELGEVCEIETGKLNANESVEDGKYPFFTTAKEISRINSFRWNTEALLIAGNANVGDVKYYSGKFEAYQRTYVLTNFSHNVKARFLLHIIKQGLKSYLENNTNKAAMSYIVISTLKSFPIPIPPLEIQEKIVQILDKMTEYVTELTSELTSRKKQYSFYRDKLLSFEDEVYQVEWKTLSEIAKVFGRGKSKHRPRNDARLYGGDIPFIQTGDIRGAGKWIENFSKTYSDFGLEQSKKWEKGTLCITIAANIAETGLLGFDACFPDSIIGFVANPEFAITEYVYYYLNSIKDHLANKSYGSAQDNLNLAIFSSLKIPVPSLEIQSRIVEVLDNFDTICNDLYIGLPKEIELRQKQYEYWRKMMFNFNKKGDSIL